MTHTHFGRALNACPLSSGPLVIRDISSFSFTRRSACSVIRLSGSSNLAQIVSPAQLRVRCERAQPRRCEETRPVIHASRRYVGRRDARPFDHPVGPQRRALQLAGQHQPRQLQRSHVVSRKARSDAIVPLTCTDVRISASFCWRRAIPVRFDERDRARLMTALGRQRRAYGEAPQPELAARD